MRVFHGNGSGSRIKVIQRGTGDGLETTLRLLGATPTVKRLADGVELTVTGEWELAELAAVLQGVAAPLLRGRGDWISEISLADDAADFVMPYGKHKGKRLAECPEDYVRWLVDNITDHKIRDRAKVLLNRSAPTPRPGDAFTERP